MSEQRKKLLEAIHCCRGGSCEWCPLQVEICDELAVEMISLPAELVDRIEEEIAEERY